MFVVVAVLLAACSGSQPQSEPADAPAEDPEASVTAPAQAPPIAVSQTPQTVPDSFEITEGLLLVLDIDGGPTALTIRSRDGEIVTTLSNNSALSNDSATGYWLPIWAPDASRVGWAEFAGGGWSLVTANTDGSRRRSSALPARPDYLTFGSSTSEVLALTPSVDGFGLYRIDTTMNNAPVELVDLGQPYYFDLSPSGDRVIGHVGSATRVVSLSDGSVTELDDTGASYQTPAWHPFADVVFYARTATSDGGEIIRHDLGSDVATVIATFGTFAFFSVSPTGEHLAVSTFDAGDESETELVALSDDPARLGGGLWIIDVANGDATRLFGDVTLATVWNPIGSSLLTRTAIAGPGSWRVFDLDGSVTGTPEHEVSPRSLMSFMLQFWDQYMQGQSTWAPDGTAFVYTATVSSATGEDGEDTVFIHDADENGESRKLASGDMAFFSPR
jgi:hypothetical protein